MEIYKISPPPLYSYLLYISGVYIHDTDNLVKVGTFENFLRVYNFLQELLSTENYIWILKSISLLQHKDING